MIGGHPYSLDRGSHISSIRIISGAKQPGHNESVQDPGNQVYAMPTCKLCNDKCESLQALARVCTLELIKRDHPGWVEDDGACPKCKAYYESLEGVVSVVGNYPKE